MQLKMQIAYHVLDYSKSNEMDEVAMKPLNLHFNSSIFSSGYGFPTAVAVGDLSQKVNAFVSLKFIYHVVLEMLS